MTFEELGASLRVEREKRNLGIDDVANRLKINPRQLRALESGDIKSLPHLAYVKGFIRSYASWLGMDDEDIHKALENIHSTPLKSARPMEDERISEPAPVAPKKGKGLFVFVILCVLCGCGYYVWSSGLLDPMLGEMFPQRVEKPRGADNLMAANEASQDENRQKTPEPTREMEKSNPLSSPLSSSVDTIPAPVAERKDPAPVAEKNTPVPVAVEPMPAQTEAEEKLAAPPAPNADSAGHKLIITAVEECWIHSNADKTDTRQFSLRKGDTFALTFADSLELKLGNAGGVRLRYDGQDLPAPGTSGQVKTISFPPKSNS